MGPVGVGHLPDQPRLADARLADEGHDLAVPRGGAAERLAELLQLRCPGPTKRVSPRAAAAWSRERRGPAPSSS